MPKHYELAMSRAEFDTIFKEILSGIQPYKLSAVLLHTRDMIGEITGNRRMAKSLKNRKKIPKWKTKYDDYLASELWKEIREKVLLRDNHRCLCCNNPASQVHHRSYSAKVMEGKDLTKLASICKFCHDKIHFQDDGKRRVRKDTEKEFIRLSSMDHP